LRADAEFDTTGLILRNLFTTSRCGQRLCERDELIVGVDT